MSAEILNTDIAAIEGIDDRQRQIVILMERGYSEGEAEEMVAIVRQEWDDDLVEVQDDGTWIGQSSGRPVEQGES